MGTWDYPSLSIASLSWQQQRGSAAPFGILTHDPNHGRFGIGLIQTVQILAEIRDNDLVPNVKAGPSCEKG